MGKNWAIAIGINNYDNLQPLKFAQRDAEVMASWFREEAQFDQIFLFTENSPPIPANPPIITQPTNARFRRFLNFQFDTPLLNPEDNLWFFFAGHGKRYNDQDYLMFPDSDPTDSTTAISVDFITQRLRRCGADNVVLLLDACRDEGSRGGLGIGQEEHQGVITFYSCNAKQQSFEIDELQHGAFTHSLLEGLRLQGEANCATVERLNQYLNRRVPQINTNYRKPIQNPYLKAEPPYKVYSILLEQSATLKDVEPLRYQAALAENKGDLQLAKQLWIRVLAISRVDLDAIAAIERIAQKPQQSSSNTNPRGTNSTGQRSVSPFELEEAERRKQQEAEKKRQKQADEELRRQEQEVQKQREREEAEARKQQQEADKKRQQKLDRQRKEQEAEIRRQQQAERWQNLQQFIVNRRQFLKWVGLGSGGLVTTVVASQFIPPKSPQSNTKINTPRKTPLTLTKFEFETVAGLNKTGNNIKPEKKESKLFQEDLGNGVSLDMVYIPPGSFMMGTEDAEIERLVKKFNWTGYRTEKPQHQVTVPTFYMGKHPITQAQWKAVAALPQINRELKPEPSKFKGDNLPVERVSWYNAVEFCARLSKETGKEYRLPSEAEWEYACRAGTTTPFHFGETITSKLANYDASNIFAEEVKGEYRGQTTPVGEFPANGFGLHDMHGNVWEWCLDDWHSDYKGVPKDGNPWFDNKNNNLSDKTGSAVLRGGSWLGSPVLCRSAYRSDAFTRDYLNFNIGFRVVCGVGRTLQ
jgi:formylglycine-generating enzyme required for sulfatase activity/uncharacterized caspase-like protein